MANPEKRSPALGGASWNAAGGRAFHVQTATVDALLQRLEGVQKAGAGWRSCCPACGGKSRKVSIAERDGRVLVHCFGGCAADAVIGAVGLTWADLHPPRNWPQSPEERRRARQAIRESGWASALAVLALEAKIVSLASYAVACNGALPREDYLRLLTACERIDHAANVLVEVRHG